MYDITIIGAGVIGCAIARELARYRLSVCVVEKEEDVCSGTSKANSAIIHAGYDAKPGTLKARFNVEGNRLMEPLSQELDFEFVRNGSLVLCFREEDRPGLEELYERGLQNGVPDLRILSASQVKCLEPNLADSVAVALYAPTGGIVCPFGLTIALAENAADNGVVFLLETRVRQVTRQTGSYAVETDKGMIESRFVVNAAGVYADIFHNMVSRKKIHITARKGEYCLLDKQAGGHVSHTVFQLPGKSGKGVLVTPTVHGNLLVGPTALDIDDKEGTDTSQEGITEALSKAACSVRDLPIRQIITSFAGLRAHEDGEEFILGEPEDAPGFFDAAGMESPGLSCAPAIGRFLAEQIAHRANAALNPDFCPTRKGILRPWLLSFSERAALIREHPAYGNIICRCEGISEGELLDAIHRTLGAKSLDALKRRTRAGMGRCQAGFCTPKAMEILARELGIPMEEVCKNNEDSPMITGRRKWGEV